MAIVRMEPLGEASVPNGGVDVILNGKNGQTRITPRSLRRDSEGMIECVVGDADILLLGDAESVFLDLPPGGVEVRSRAFADGEHVKDFDVNNLPAPGAGAPAPEEPDASGNLACWMDANYALLHSKRLSALSLPGTHNSGVYSPENTIWFRCQEDTIRKQLEKGVRYLDIRIMKARGEYFMHHNGAYSSSQSLNQLITDLNWFLNAYLREIVIVDLCRGDGSNLTDAEFLDVKMQFITKLGALIFHSEGRGTPANVRFGEMIEKNRRLLLITEDIFFYNAYDGYYWTERLRSSTWTSAQEGVFPILPIKIDNLSRHIDEELKTRQADLGTFVVYSFNIWALPGVWPAAELCTESYLYPFFNGTPRKGMRIAVFDFIKESVIRGVIACNNQ